MAEEISLRLLFPQVGIPEDVHAFNVNKDVSAILEYSVSKYQGKVLPSSQIYISNEQHLYDLVPSGQPISKLKLNTQTQVVIVPESYVINITDPRNKTTPLKVKSTLLVGDIVRYICVHSRSQDPKFYQFSSKGSVFDHSLQLAAQAPFTKDFTISLLEPNALLQLLQKDFVEGKISCSEKEASYIIASLNISMNGPYKSSETKQMIEANLSKLIPKNMEPKKILSNAVSLYKSLQMSPTLISDLCKNIMNLHHFYSMVMDGERYYGLIGKKMSKDKVTISLGFSVLKFYKQGSLTVYDSYDLDKIKNLQKNEFNSFRFEYADQKGTMQIKVVSADIDQMYKVITDRLKMPTSGRHSGSSCSGDAMDKLAIPPFAQLFSFYSEVSRSELMQVTTRVVFTLFNKVKENVLVYQNDVKRSKLEISRKFFAGLKLAASMLRLIDESAALTLFDAFAKLEEKDTLLEKMSTEKRNYADTLRTGSLSSREREKKMQEIAEFEEKFQTTRKETSERAAKFLEVLESTNDAISQKITDASVIQLRPIAISCIRAVILTLFNYYWINEKSQCAEQINDIKEKILFLTKSFGDVSSYSIKGSKIVLDAMNSVKELTKSANNVALSVSETDPEKPYLHIITVYTAEEVSAANERLETYFKENEPKELAKPLTKEITKVAADETRRQVKLSKEILSQLSTKIEDINDAEEKIKKLYVYVSTILGMAPENTHEPVIMAFNDMKTDVERSFVTNGASDPTASCQRCGAALDAAFQAMNPANDLRNQLEQFPAEDPRVLALRPIIDYLDENGPLFNGSPTQVDIQRFIMQMSLAKTETLDELAYTVESHVPENLRNLRETCDPIKDLYKEVEGELDINQLADQAKESSQSAVKAATTLRKSVRDYERECSKKYRSLNLYLWRTMKIFTQFSIDEQPETIGHKTFEKCREAIKVLIEETAFDMKRDRTFLPFITGLTDCFNKVCQDPHDAESVGELITFLMDHQTRRSFHEAARSLNEYHHLILCNDSDKAARQLVSEGIIEYEFKATAIMISQIKSRLINLQEKITKAMKTKDTIDIRRSHVDLREDYELFIKKFIENVFIVFTQMIAAKSRNRGAIKSLASGVEAIEKLFPLVMNIEYPAPYLSRSVCGIVLYSMDALLNESKVYGGKALQCATDAQLAVREFLFNVRRKIASIEREQAMVKPGIGIPDMQVVVDRENRAITAASEFQRSIRKQKFKYQ